MLVEQMTWEEYRDAIGRAVVILPVGSLEQHGPHLPLSTDTVIPGGMAMMVAEVVDAMILPSITYGYKSHPASGGGPSFPGTTSLDGSTLTHLVLDILRDTYRHGGRKIMVLNAHYENAAFVAEAIDLLLREVRDRAVAKSVIARSESDEAIPDSAEGDCFASLAMTVKGECNSRKVGDDLRVLLVNWWELVSQQTLDELFAKAGFPGWEMEHAALTETSLVQYLAPELVREDRIIDDRSGRTPRYSIFPPPDDIVPRSGVLYKATFASREKGERLAREVVEAIVDIIREEFGI
jgi:creatinine amidohydrolase